MERPSFRKELISGVWLLLKIAAPIVGWVGGCIWIGRNHLPIAVGVMWGGILLAMVGVTAYQTYQWKRRDFDREFKRSGPLNEAKPEERNHPRRWLTKFVGSPGGRETVPRDAATTPPPPAVWMPLDYLQPERRHLFEAAIGEDVYIDFTDVQVDLEGRTWVETTGRLYEREGLSTVKVQLLESGGYTLTIRVKTAVPFRFTPRELYSGARYAPVVRIVEVEPVNKRF